MAKKNIDQILRSRDFDARNWRIETGALVKNLRSRSGVQTPLGECLQWKAKGQCLKGDRCSFRQDENKCVKTTPMSTRPLCRWLKMMGEKVREAGLREIAVHLRSYLDRRAGSTVKVNPQLYLAVFGIHLIAKDTNLSRGVNSAIRVRSRIGRLRNSQARSRKNCDKKCSCCIERCTTIGVSTSGRRAAEVFVDLTEEHKSSETNKTCKIHKNHTGSL